jgi:hypothetical protein
MASGERIRGLGCEERYPVFACRATLGMRLERQRKRLSVQVVALAFAALVAVDRGNRGIELLVVQLFVFAVFLAMSLVFIRDRARKGDRRTIKPTDCGRWSSPDNVATATVVPEGESKDEQEEPKHYTGIS